MMLPPFTGNFTQQAAIPQVGIAAAVVMMRSRRLHRDKLAPGKVKDATALKRDLADWQRAGRCTTIASGEQAQQVAVRASVDNWRYAKRQEPLGTDAILAGAFEMRLPLTIGLAECGLDGVPVLREVSEVTAQKLT